MPQQAQLTGWRLDVRNWLAAVIQQQNRSFHYRFNRTASDMKSQFPRSFWVGLAIQLVKPLGVWIVKSALKDAANDMGLTISDVTLEFLSELAVDALVSG
jgi:hypothetical protein